MTFASANKGITVGNAKRLRITTPEAPSEQDLQELAAGLKAFNHSIIPEYVPQKVGSFIRTPEGKVLGGIYGVLNWGWLYVDWLWCDESIRGKGYGSDLLEAVEHHALNQGIMPSLRQPVFKRSAST